MTSPPRARPSIRLQGSERQLEVAVRESERARTMRIIVGPRRPLEVIVPAGTPATAIKAFLKKKHRWVESKVSAAEAIASRPQALGLAGQLWLGGQPLAFELIPTDGMARAELRADVLRIHGRSSTAEVVAARWYRRQARRRVVAVVEREAKRLKLSYNSIAVRDQRTRWGSCSAKGNLSFSWRLILAPEEVLEYVVVHELLHLREPSHSKSFWRLLDSTRPDWREQARWLRENGQELHDYELASALKLRAG